MHDEQDTNTHFMYLEDDATHKEWYIEMVSYRCEIFKQLLNYTCNATESAHARSDYAIIALPMQTSMDQPHRKVRRQLVNSTHQ